MVKQLELEDESWMKHWKLGQPFFATEGRHPIPKYACKCLQETMYMPASQDGWSAWVGQPQEVYWLGRGWGCESCAKQKGLVW